MDRNGAGARIYETHRGEMMIPTWAKWGAGIIASVIGLAVIVFVLENIAVPRIEEGYGEGQERAWDSSGADYTPQWSSDGDVIVLNRGQRLVAFNSDGGSRWNIAGSEAGSDESSLAYHSPSVADDGRIAYQRSQYEEGIFGLGSPRFKRYIETANLDYSDVERIQGINSDGILPIVPVWSPDNASLAFIIETSERLTNTGYEYERKRRVVVVDRNGEIASRVLIPRFVRYDSPEWIKSSLVWSNGSQHVAVIASGEGTTERVQRIVTIRTDGSKQTTIAETSNRLSLPGWSPSDERLYYVQSDGITKAARSILYSVKNDGSNRRNIADLGGNLLIRSVKPSPDGDKLLLIDSSNGIYIFGIDGTGLTHIAYGEYASWSPDGKRIAVYSIPVWSNGGERLITVAEDGSDVRVLLSGVGAYSNPLPYTAHPDKTTSSDDDGAEPLRY